MKTIMKTMGAAAVAIGLSGCGEVARTAADLQAETGAAVEERAVADAVVSAVDLEAAKDLAKGAVRAEIREALPVGEAAAVAAVIDEKALVDGLGSAIDTDALRGAVDGAIQGEARKPAPAGE